MIATLALKLILAHLVGDFLLQPTKWVIDKTEKKHKSKYLYYHIGVHLLLMLVILQFTHILGVVIITVSHLLIDLGKLHFTTKKNARILFVVDQIIHLLVITAVVYGYIPFIIDATIVFANNTLLFLISLLFSTVVTSIIMQQLLMPWSEAIQAEQKSLKSAGKYIGILERLLVFAFILLNSWTAIGFLFTAKSVFRFGDLSEAKNRKLTEYVLIGTLLSFGLAIFSGLAYMYLKTKIG